MVLPVKEPYRISSPYGWRTLQGKKEFHSGIDFVSDSDSEDVLAIADGIVVYDQDDYDDALRWVDKHHSAGNMVILQHEIDGQSYYVRYLHLLENTIKKGERVNEGDVIGQYADVGRSFGAHLHIDAYDVDWKKLDITQLFIAGGIDP
jgi:murein DD-endopeptidase MepM/ murein hydrolase activator NlpD